MILNKDLLRSASGKDKEVLERLNEFTSYALPANDMFRYEAKIDSLFLSGSQDFYNNLYGPLFKERRENFYFNRIRPVINGISGRQRQQRKTSVVIPRENGDQATADQLSKVLLWVMDNDNMLHTISDAFDGAITSGINLLQIWLDYNSDPLSGDIRVSNCPYNTFIIDPYFTRHDLSDCSGIIKRALLPQREICNLLPQYADEIVKIHPSGNAPFLAGDRGLAASSQGLMSYVEYWYRDFRTQTLLMDTETKFTYEWNGAKENLEYFLYENPNFRTIDNEVPTVKCAIIVEGTVFCDENFIGIDSYPFVPVFSYFQPEIDDLRLRFQSVVRSMRDAQYIYNRRLILETQGLESTAQTGFIYKENALVNPDDVYRTGTGRSIAVKDGYPLNEALAQIPQQVIPQTTQQLRQSYADEILRCSGYNEEMLGAAEDETAAGVLVMLRQRAGLVSFEKLFDQLDLSQKILSKKIMSIIQQQFIPEKIKQAIGRDKELSPSFYSKVFGKYDCSVVDGYNTTTQKQIQFAQLVELRKLGVQISDETLIEAATIQNKNDIIKTMQDQQQQQAQMQQQEMQMKTKELEAEIDVLKAKAQSDQALAAERISSIDEKKMSAVERIAEAEKDQQDAKLTQAKMIKELENMDIAQIEKILTLSKMLKGDIDEEYKKSAGAVQTPQTDAMDSAGQQSGEYGDGI